MFHVIGASAANIAVDVTLAFSGFFVGLAGAIAYYRLSPARGGTMGLAGPDSALPAESVANNAARAHMAAQQLRDLAKNVASDVGAHNTLVESIADQLAGLKDADEASAPVVMEAVAKMLEANKKLATRLEDAEQKIQNQAEEIRVQQSEARTDALTQLANRRAFDACLEENIQRFLKSGTPFSMLLMDVDHFKQFNDVHGHLAGDEVLRCVGQTLSRTVKAGDLACRYGGEEFAVIMSNTK
jgi:diguanylate cyclase